MSVDPLAVTDPSAWCGNRTWATPVPARAYTKPKNTRHMAAITTERRKLVSISELRR